MNGCDDVLFASSAPTFFGILSRDSSVGSEKGRRDTQGEGGRVEKRRKCQIRNLHY